ncbi:N-acetyl-gamma-glutamyl-phosphate reductase [uncultured Campylobacter sp.]|uniref:N-acetyl-gamma-glutamyl-phosphate reductase n=1 Tax=uncultured Campylobacter sp. TaxID=218934 RepID=UPI002602F6BB|nr:N-acetyl-gamma-glutamyl-phosphate reductase [uncultured Campylobacter sp.]
MKKVGIIGVSGYTGLELIKALLSHPSFEISYLGASAQGEISEIFPQLRGVFEMRVEAADARVAAQRCELVFLALPHEKAMEFAREILKFKSVKVVDLSADYRLSRELYEKNYTAHLDPRNLAHAVYGLPELNREKIRAARLTANPGCYPTCAILALAPFVRLLDPALGVFIDAKSGVSGAGKALKTSSHFVSVNENAGAYSPISHRHADEIKEQLQILRGGEFSTLFVPNLLPITRGMLVSAFGVLQKSVDAEAVLREFYANEPFVRVRSEPVNIKNVVGTHFCDIFVKTAGDKIWINSAIDNLLRGASSQAVANANLMCGFAEATALPRIAHGI